MRMLALALTILLVENASAATWNPAFDWQHPLPQGNTFRSVVVADSLSATRTGERRVISSGGWGVFADLLVGDSFGIDDLRTDDGLHATYTSSSSHGGKYVVVWSGGVAPYADGGTVVALPYPGTDLLSSVSLVDKDTIVVAGDNGAIWRSTDCGSTWLQRDSGTTVDIRAMRFGLLGPAGGLALDFEVDGDLLQRVGNVLIRL